MSDHVTPDLLQRFFSKTRRIKGGCWEWIGLNVLWAYRHKMMRTDLGFWDYTRGVVGGLLLGPLVFPFCYWLGDR